MFSRFLKVFIFGFIFSLKISLRLKTMITSIKTLKKYCKGTFNVFKKKKKIDDDNKFLTIG